MTNPNAVKNLTKRGAEANPNGRPPKGYSITEAFKEMLGANPDRKAKLVEKIMDKAERGDIAAQKLVWNYMDGMPQQSTDITSGGDKLELPTIFIPQEKDD